MTIYLGKHRIKSIDKVVLGYEIPNEADSIFYKGIRLMNYSGAFAWHFGAKRSKLLYLRDKFDTQFQRPFKIFFRLVVSGGFGMVVLYILDEFFLHITQ